MTLSSPLKPAASPITGDMETLMEFFNHGVLPFVGRERPVEQALRFWRETAGASALRGAVVTGEAGAGKSRFLDEITPRVVLEGGIVVHAKLYPGSSTSIAPLLARAIRFSGAGRQLLKKDPEERLEDVIAALQRMARLRPVLLVVEDAHLLAGDALGEFAMLLESLSAEALSLLALVRPSEAGARGVLERYLVEEIELRPLQGEDIAGVWRRLFGTEAEADVTAILSRVTLGNALALRSALRGALKSEAIRQRDGAWRVTIPLGKFEEHLLHNISLLSEGMAAHLTPDEKQAAERIASLGEIFSREAASLMIENAGELVDRLLFKGIVVSATATVETIAGGVSGSPPLAFTHTLFHKYVVEHTTPNPARLLAVIASEAPLYSILPFELLAGSRLPLSLDPALAAAAFGRLLGAATMLDRTPDWQLGSVPLEVARTLLESAVRPGPDADAMRLRWTIARLDLLRRETHTENYRALAEELVELMSGDLPESLLPARLTALRHLFVAEIREDVEIRMDLWKRASALIDAHPGLAFTAEYLSVLHLLSAGTTNALDREIVQRVELELERLLSAPETTEAFRRAALGEVAANFLWMFNSPEELRKRLDLLDELQGTPEGSSIPFQLRRIAFMDGLGNATEALRLIDELLPRLRDLGLFRHAAQCRLIAISSLGASARTLEELEALARTAIDDAPETIREMIRRRAGKRLVKLGILRGEMGWVGSMIEQYDVDIASLEENDRVVLELDRTGDPRSIVPLLRESSDDFPSLLADLCAGQADTDTERTIGEIEGMLTPAPLTRGDITGLHAVLDILLLLRERPDARPLVEALQRPMHRALTRMLEWLGERSQTPYMLPLLRKYGHLLTRKEADGWSRGIEEMTSREKGTEANAMGDQRLEISMLGVVETRSPGAEPVRLRGSRLATVLGLLVADRMLVKPLSSAEFRRIAAGGEDDPERARKMMSMAVLRLREALGAEAILTDGDTPRLNLDMVRVDILEAHTLLHQSLGDARHGAFMRAYALLIEATDRTRGDVPFPSLYDSFFEAVREDFEHTLRDAIIAVGSGLLREGDAASAEEALRRGFTAMPEDEEIVSLLLEALVQQGKRVEAERVQAISAEAVGG